MIFVYLIHLHFFLFTQTSSTPLDQPSINAVCPLSCLCTWVAEDGRGREKEADKGTDSYDMDCSLQSLTRVLEVDGRVLAASLVRLNLHSNHISILKKNSFSSFSTSNISHFTEAYDFRKQSKNSSRERNNNNNYPHNGRGRRAGLSHLNLVSNGMLHMEVGCFDHLTFLVSLILSHNHLSHLDADIFSHLHNLQHLDLSSNYLYDTEHTHLSFQPLFNLHRLDLSFNNFHFLPLGSGFERCSKLAVVDFSGNSLHTLEPGPFQVMRFWEHKDRHLIFNDCHIKHIHPATFHYIPSFSGISLSRNHAIKHSDFKSILDEIAVESLTFMDLSDIDLHDINHLSFPLKFSVKLEKLILSNNKLKVIPKGVFFFLTKLRTLDLSQNMIRHIENLAGLARLERLLLASNDLRSLSEEMFSGLQELKHLDVSFNDLQHVESSSFSELFNLHTILAQGNSIQQVELDGGLENLQSLDLNFNKLSNLNFVSSLPNLNFFSVSHNSLENLTNILLIRTQRLRELDVSMNSIVQLNKNFFQYLQAHKVDLSGNKLSSIAYYGWKTNNQIKILNLQNNGAVELKEDSFVNLNDLLELNLGKNRLNFLPPNIFKHVGKLKILNLNDNPLGKFLDTEVSIFQPLSNLRQLFISRIGLQVSSERLFYPIKKLSELDISSNRLAHLFTPLTATLPELSTLNVSNNHLSFIEQDVSSHFSSNKRHLDISNNPFRCDCSLLATCHLLDSLPDPRNHHSHYNLHYNIAFVSLASHHHFCYEPRSKRGSSVEVECEVITSTCQQVSMIFPLIIIIISVAATFFFLLLLLLICCIVRHRRSKRTDTKEKKVLPETYMENSKLLPVSGVVKVPQQDVQTEKEVVQNAYKTSNGPEAAMNPLIAMYCGLNFKSLKVDLNTSKSSNSTSSDQSMSNPLCAKKPFV